jgi:hypothetical protein
MNSVHYRKFNWALTKKFVTFLTAMVSINMLVAPLLFGSVMINIDSPEDGAVVTGHNVTLTGTATGTDGGAWTQDTYEEFEGLR